MQYSESQIEETKYIIIMAYEYQIFSQYFNKSDFPQITVLWGMTKSCQTGTLKTSNGEYKQSNEKRIYKRAHVKNRIQHTMRCSLVKENEITVNIQV